MEHHEHGVSEHGDHGSSHGSRDKHEGHTPEMFRDRLWVSLVLTIPILYFAEPLQRWFGFDAVEFAGSTWVSPVLATVLFGYAGIVFLEGMVHELKGRLPGMMTLISIAISVAYGYSMAVSLGLDGEPFFWELATLLDVMLLGHWIEMRSVQSASKALEHLSEMIPATAHRVGSDGSIDAVPVASIVVGDRILVRPGEQVPVDGIVYEGATSMNESFLTGESRPVSREPGDEVVAGAVNGDGAIRLEATRVGGETTLSQIQRLVEEAQSSRSRFQDLADRAALWLTVIAIGVATPTFIGWLVFGTSGTTFAVARAVSVLVIACPHALGLAIPLVNVNATAIAARNGILVRNREAFERGRSLKFVAFDKTGTLTEGRFEVTRVAAVGMEEAEALRLAAAIEQSSEHPLAEAIVAAAAAPLPGATDVEAVAGKGLVGTVDGRRIRIGRPEWATELGHTIVDDVLEAALSTADDRGESAVVLIDGDHVVAVIAMGDRVRDSARAAIGSLRSAGIEPVMITGDAEAVARTVAGELGIDRYHARVLPGDKARLVEELSAEGPVAFVGDGINDAPALVTADLGMAIGAGTSVAIESADLVLVDDDPADVATALDLSRRTSSKMRQNLAWATGYNVLAIPLAAGIGAPWGLFLDPAVGALLMSGSTVVVAINAMLLRRGRRGVGRPIG